MNCFVKLVGTAVSLNQKPERETHDEQNDRESHHQLFAESNSAASSNVTAGNGLQMEMKNNKTLEDAVKPKHRRRKNSSSS